MLRITAELPKMVGTIATYIVYDNLTQCFGTWFKAGSNERRFDSRPVSGIATRLLHGPGRLSGRCSRCLATSSWTSSLFRWRVQELDHHEHDQDIEQDQEHEQADVA